MYFAISSLLFEGDEVIQAAAVPLQDEADAQAVGSAVAIVEGLDKGKLIVNIYRSLRLCTSGSNRNR